MQEKRSLVTGGGWGFSLAAPVTDLPPFVDYTITTSAYGKLSVQASAAASKDEVLARAKAHLVQDCGFCPLMVDIDRARPAAATTFYAIIDMHHGACVTCGRGSRARFEKASTISSDDADASVRCVIKRPRNARGDEQAPKAWRVTWGRTPIVYDMSWAAAKRGEPKTVAPCRARISLITLPGSVDAFEIRVPKVDRDNPDSTCFVVLEADPETQAAPTNPPGVWSHEGYV